MSRTVKQKTFSPGDWGLPVHQGCLGEVGVVEGMGIGVVELTGGGVAMNIVRAVIMGQEGLGTGGMMV